MGGFLERVGHAELRDIFGPFGVWWNRPDPSDEVLNEPRFSPSEMTIPRGLPSGVKNPALIAAMPL